METLSFPDEQKELSCLTASPVSEKIVGRNGRTNHGCQHGCVFIIAKRSKLISADLNT